jgi:hypothetical protein
MNRRGEKYRHHLQAQGVIGVAQQIGVVTLTISTLAPKSNMKKKSPVRLRNDPSSNERAYRYRKNK